MFFFDWFSFCLREMISCFFLCFFCPSCVPQFLAASSPKSDVFFMKTLHTLPALQMMSELSLQDQLAGWPAQLIATTNAAAMGLLQFEIDDGTTNGWFSKCGSWFRLDSVWHRPVLGQLPVMSQEIFRVHVSLQKCLLRLPTMLHTSSPWLRPRHNNTFFIGITTRSYFLLQATTFYLSNTYHSHTMCRIRQAASDTDYC